MPLKLDYAPAPAAAQRSACCSRVYLYVARVNKGLARYRWGSGTEMY